MKTLKFDWGLDTAVAVFIGAGLVGIGVAGSGRPTTPLTQEDAVSRPDPRIIASAFTSADKISSSTTDIRKVAFKRRDTLMDVLVRAGAERSDASGAVVAMSALTDLRYSKPGDQVTAFVETGADDATPRLIGVSIRPEPGRHLLVARNSKGDWKRHDLQAQLTPSVAKTAGEIKGSIYETALSQGATDQQVVDFAEIFAYDVDFQREIWPGDEFEIVYETFADERGKAVKTGAVLYAALKGQTIKEKRFYRFTPDDDNVTDYFDETGQSAKKFLMRTPINGARLSSGFGNRKHPILGYTKLHKGTDFAAPRGTPIYAAGNGVIERADRYGTYGNYVRIRHANGYKTAYAHLNGFSKRAKAGQRVRQGEVIGYVGTTGRSTGPHLHYEVYINGKPVNAMSLKLPRGRKLEGDVLQAFEAERARIDALRATALPVKGSAETPLPGSDLIASADFEAAAATDFVVSSGASGDVVSPAGVFGATRLPN
ncbi:peptidoglycan DD-metalloendopeptidase family protein [bacterium]|nr:peptidoglycan DD-metalloendopeptidase family protein [bacterium]